MTENSFTKLVSVRVEIDIAKKLEDYVNGHRYLNRSSLINRILKKTIGNMTEDEFFNLIKF